MAQQGFIKFDPDIIAEVASDLQNRHNIFFKNITDIRARVDALRTNWSSDARANNYFDEFDALNREGEELAQLLNTMAGNLFRVSGRYEEGERTAVNKVEALPTQGVFRN